MSEEACEATLERPNTSFIASFDNILAILIMAFQTSFVWLYHIIHTHSPMKVLYITMKKKTNLKMYYILGINLNFGNFETIN